MYVVAQVATLKDATQQAILTNPEVMARWHNFLAAGSERGVAAGGYLPSVNLGAGVGRDRVDNRLGNTEFQRNSITLSLNQMLYDGFLTSNEVKRLDHTHLVRLFELYDTSENIALEVVRAYSDVLRYRKLVALAEDNYVRHRTVFEQIQRKAKAGVGRRVDLEQISGRVALAEANLLTETSNLHDVSARFQRLVGAMPGKDLENPSLILKGLPATVNGALNEANKKHPTLLAAIENIRSVNSSASARRSALQPRLDFRVRSERGNDIDNISGRTTNNTAEIVMSWNLFNGGSDMARVRQTADLLNLARDQRDKACRDVRQTLLIAYNDTRKLNEQMRYLDQHQLSIEKAREAYRQQFDIGQRSLLDLLDTENELFQAKRAYANAEYDLILAYARTQAGMGTLHFAMGLNRQEIKNLPNPGNLDDKEEISNQCPVEGDQMYVVDKDSLNARAVENLAQQSPMPEAAAAAVSPSLPMKEVAPSPSQAAVMNALKNWREAWVSMKTDAYLGFYAKNYSGDARWKASRSNRLKGAKKISLELSGVTVSMQDATHATTTFHQDYRSSVYKDIVYKTLYWKEVDGKWVIEKEKVEGPGKAKQW